MVGGRFEGTSGSIARSGGGEQARETLNDVHRALVEVDDANGVLVVTPLVRRLDAECAPQLRPVLAHLVSERRLVIVCLTHVVSIDCSGLAALVSAVKRLGPGGELRLVAACDSVRSLISATHLDDLLPVFDDVVSAASP